MTVNRVRSSKEPHVGIEPPAYRQQGCRAGDVSPRHRFNICKCETTEYLKRGTAALQQHAETSGQFKVFVTEPDISARQVFLIKSKKFVRQQQKSHET